MRHLSLQIPDNKFDFFIELLQNLSYAEIDSIDDDIPKEQQQMVLERLEEIKEDPTKLVDLEEVKNDWTFNELSG